MQHGIALRLIGMTTMVLFFSSCQDISFTREGYLQALRSGLKQIPAARQMEEVYGDVDHFISYHGSLEVGNDWNTEVFLHGRYELTMQVPVRMGRDFDQVLGVEGEPTFYLHEVDRIEIDPDGTIGASYNGAGQRTFGIEEWKMIYEADGDLSVLGITVKKRPLENWDRYVAAGRRPRIKLPPEDERETPETEE